MRFGSILTVMGLCLAATACNDGSRAVMKKEDLLTASGFTSVPANTPARQAAFRRLPPHKFVREIRGDRVIYVYADPTVCVCIYVGGQKAYGLYRTGVSEEKAMIAADIDMANWSWTEWGDGYPMGWPYNDPAFYAN